jgi:hypothetical protein
MTTEPLVIGAALTVPWIETWRDWLFEADRDVEVQSFHAAEVLDGDWRPLADRARAALAGHRGRIGIHGPFWGFPSIPSTRRCARWWPGAWTRGWMSAPIWARRRW